MMLFERGPAMRRTVILLSTTLALASVQGFADATVVDGDHLPASVSVLSQSCDDPGTTPTAAPVARITRGPLDPPNGNFSIGWMPQGEGFGVGPAIHLDRPNEFTSYAVTIYSPNSYAAAIAVATWVQQDRRGLWKGVTVLADDHTAGWHEVTVPAETTYTWRHYDAHGTLDETEADRLTLRNLINDRGGDENEGADVGLIYGCDGDPMYFDAIEAADEFGTVASYDFEGYQTRMALGAGSKARQVVTITKGDRIALHAKLTRLFNKKALDGTVLLEAKRQGARSYTRVLQRATGGDGGLPVTVKPAKSTTYRASYAGTSTTEGSSATVRVKVRR